MWPILDPTSLKEMVWTSTMTKGLKAETGSFTQGIQTTLNCLRGWLLRLWLISDIPWWRRWSLCGSQWWCPIFLCFLCHRQLPTTYFASYSHPHPLQIRLLSLLRPETVNGVMCIRLMYILMPWLRRVQCMRMQVYQCQELRYTGRFFCTRSSLRSNSSSSILHHLITTTWATLLNWLNIHHSDFHDVIEHSV